MQWTPRVKIGNGYCVIEATVTDNLIFDRILGGKI